MGLGNYKKAWKSQIHTVPTQCAQANGAGTGRSLSSQANSGLRSVRYLDEWIAINTFAPCITFIFHYMAPLQVRQVTNKTCIKFTPKNRFFAIGISLIISVLAYLN